VQLDDLTLRDAPEIAEMFPHRRVHPEIAEADAALIVAAVNALPALCRVALAAKDYEEAFRTPGHSSAPKLAALRAVLGPFR
jgi:hypothetical protein